MLSSKYTQLQSAALLVLLVPSISTLAAMPSARAAVKRPNIILFLIDDLGWADLGVTGSTFYETPNVDALAKAGAFFTDAYAANPVCSPTRASILTGKYPSRIGLTNHSGYNGPKGPDHQLMPPEIVGNMPPEDTTLAEALQGAGYTTAHIGKWHLQAHHDTSRDHFPQASGFDVNIAGHRGGHPNSFYYPYKGTTHPAYDVPDLEDGKAGDYLTDVLTDRAIGFLEAQADNDQPFFLNMWYYTVHTPIQPRKDKLQKYQKKAKAMGLNATMQDALPDHQSLTHAHQDNAAYACMVESMDENIGRILGRVKSLGLEQDTLIVFLSDNGGLSTGSGAMSPTSCFPLRAGKAWVYEGGIRSPLIIKLPGVVKAGQQIAEPAISTDIYPTILQLAGLPLRPEQHLDGVSLQPLLTGKKESLDREAIYFHYPHYHHINTMGPAGAVRRGDFKLVEVFETGKVELYNLRDDIGEQHDLATEMPELAEELTHLLHDWREMSGAVMPVAHPDYTPANDYRGSIHRPSIN
jgi:arylsulfatase A-like enzyme